MTEQKNRIAPAGMKKWEAFQKWLPALFLAVMAAVTLWMDVFVAQNLLDGDASDFMVRGYTFFQKGNPFSNDYYLTTESRLLDIPFVFFLFFHLFSDWTLVRVCGTVLIQAVYVLSFLFVLRQAGIRRSVRLTAAGFLLLPFSVNYARIVLYHIYYALYLAQVFLLLGLTLALMRPGRKTSSRIGLGVLYVLLWLYTGVNGIRILMTLGGPLVLLCLCGVLRFFRQIPATREGLRSLNGRNQPILRLTGLTLLGLAGFFAGYIIYARFVVPYYGLSDQANRSFYLPGITPETLLSVLTGFLETIGVRVSQYRLVSVRGVSLMAALGVFGLLLFLSGRHMLREKTPEKRILSGLFLASYAVNTGLFFLNLKGSVFYLYYVPVVSMAFLTLAVEWDGVKEKICSVTRCLLAGCLALGLLFQGAYTIRYIRHCNGSSWDTWTGLPHTEIDTAAEARECAAFMQKEGYTHGMAIYWYASVIMEVSNGQEDVVPCMLAEDGTVIHFPWGSRKSAFYRENLPDEMIVFLADGYDVTGRYPEAVQVFSGSRLNGYLIPTDEVLLPTP